MPRCLTTRRVVLLCGWLATWAAGAAAGSEIAEIALVAADGVPVVVEKVRLVGATRDAFRARGTVEGALPGHAGTLVASTGLRGTAADDVAFRIEIDDGGGWTEVLAATVAADGRGWVDHRADVAGVASPWRRIRLRAELPDGAAAGELEAFWGSLRYLPGGDGERPLNVVLISLDTLGARYLGSHGGVPEASRHIDGFLSRAFSFRRAYATYPNTLVSHASLFSGLYPTSRGGYGSIREDGFTFDSLATVLRGRGYLTAAYTENAFVSSDFGFDNGFDWYDDGPEGGDAFLGDAAETFGRARGWLERFGDDAPFLLFVHTYEVHSPYIARNADSLRIADSLAPAPIGDGGAGIGSTADREHLHNAGYDRYSPDEVRRLAALHVGEIHYLDQVFSEFVRALEAMPFADRTLVVVLSDHGDEFDPNGMIGHGETLADVVLHVPLAFRLPRRFEGGEFDDPVSLVDVAPTILDVLGMPDTLATDGRSLRPLLDGTVAALEPRPVFAELQRAPATCAAQRLPESCFVGRFVAYSERERFEYSGVPHYELLRHLPGVDAVEPSPAQLQTFRSLLSAYVTGAPWETKAPWRPEAAAVDGVGKPVLDDVTRQRLEALGYDF